MDQESNYIALTIDRKDTPQYFQINLDKVNTKRYRIDKMFTMNANLRLQDSRKILTVGSEFRITNKLTKALDIIFYDQSTGNRLRII